MFWIGVIISLGGLLGIPLWRNWSQSRVWQATDRALDIIKSLVIFGGLVISVVSHLQSAHEREILRRSLQTTEDSLNKQGKEIADAQQKQMVAEQRLREADERELLRQVAMWLPDGALSSDVQGSMKLGPPEGQSTEIRKNIFVWQEGKITMGGKQCHTPEYIDAMRELIKLTPYDPYPLVLSVHCLKVWGDLSWRNEGIKTLKYLNKLVEIQPHVNFLDSFYDVLANEFEVERGKKRCRFRVNEDGSYTIGQSDNSAK